MELAKIDLIEFLKIITPEGDVQMRESKMALIREYFAPDQNLSLLTRLQSNFLEQEACFRKILFEKGERVSSIYLINDGTIDIKVYKSDTRLSRKRSSSENRPFLEKAHCRVAHRDHFVNETKSSVPEYVSYRIGKGAVLGLESLSHNGRLSVNESFYLYSCEVSSLTAIIYHMSAEVRF